MRKNGTGQAGTRMSAEVEEMPGIVIADGRGDESAAALPRIAAFIWGGKVKPTPTLPYGRWKGAA